MGKVKRLSIVVIILIIFLELSASFAVADETKAVLISKGNNSGQYVSLTFDVEGGTDIESVLETLNTYQVKATFFLLGTWVEKNPRLARRILAEGHEIGNHTYSHQELTKLAKEQIIKDIQKAEEIITKATGSNPRPLFRPSYGATNAKVLQAIGEAGYRNSYLWSIDPRDWDGKSAESIADLVLKNLHPEAIVLLHVNSTNTPEALPMILDGIFQKGYGVVPVSQIAGNNQIMTAQWAATKAVKLSAQGTSPFNQTTAPMLLGDAKNNNSKQAVATAVEANFAVKGKPVNMLNKPRIISNRTFVPIRELARILEGEVSWDGDARQVGFTVGKQSFQFVINGETWVNDEKLTDVPSAILINNRAMVPLFVVSNGLSLPVNWESRTKTVNLIIN